MRTIKTAGGVLAIASVIVFVCAGALAIDPGPVTASRILSSGDSNIYTFKIFPQRPIVASRSVSVLDQGPQASLPDTVSF